MAIQFVKDFYWETNDSIVVPAGGFALGNLLVIGGGWDDATSTIAGITDTGTNQWHQALQINDSGAKSGTIWYSVLTTGLVSTNTIVIDMAGNNGAWIVAEFSGIHATPLDQVMNGREVGLSHSSGSTPTTTQNDELLVGVHFGNTDTSAFTTTGTLSNQNETATPFGAYRLVMQYAIVSSTDAYESTGTTVGSTDFTNLIATFFAAAAPPATQILRPDADTTTTGWTTAPLFSKINEVSADGTIVTATAS